VRAERGSAGGREHRAPRRTASWRARLATAIQARDRSMRRRGPHALDLDQRRRNRSRGDALRVRCALVRPRVL
jgi:hypothetical protein